MVSFVAPCYYHFRYTDRPRRGIILVVPVAPGRSRMLTGSGGRPGAPAWAAHAGLLRFLDSDMWLHAAERALRTGTNAFVPAGRPAGRPAREEGEGEGEGEAADTDWEEAGGEGSGSAAARRRAAAEARRYFLATESDTGVAAWRGFWGRNLAESPVFGPPGSLAWERWART